MTTLSSRQQLFESFVREIATPVVQELEKETGQSICIVVSMIEAGTIVCRQEIQTSSHFVEGTTATGEVRVKFRDGGESRRFVAQAMIRGLAKGTGFSGFAVRGKVGVTADAPRTRITDRSNRYNVWHWDSGLECEDAGKGDRDSLNDV